MAQVNTERIIGRTVVEEEPDPYAVEIHLGKGVHHFLGLLADEMGETREEYAKRIVGDYLSSMLEQLTTEEVCDFLHESLYSELRPHFAEETKDAL